MIVPDLAAAQTGDMGGVLGSTGGRPGLGGPGGLGGTSPGGMAESYCEGWAISDTDTEQFLNSFLMTYLECLH